MDAVSFERIPRFLPFAKKSKEEPRGTFFFAENESNAGLEATSLSVEGIGISSSRPMLYLWQLAGKLRRFIRFTRFFFYVWRLHTTQTRATTESWRFDGPLLGCYHRNAGWSSLVARWAHNPKVGGSNPPPATNLWFCTAKAACC
jgi:hypothetical protein